MGRQLDQGKYYYSISEVSEHFDITPATLRHWESNFDILSPRKNKKGDRLYTADDIEAVRLIRSLVKEQGFTLKGAAAQIKAQPQILDQPYGGLTHTQVRACRTGKNPQKFIRAIF